MQRPVVRVAGGAPRWRPRRCDVDSHHGHQLQGALGPGQEVVGREGGLRQYSVGVAGGLDEPSVFVGEHGSLAARLALASVCGLVWRGRMRGVGLVQQVCTVHGATPRSFPQQLLGEGHVRVAFAPLSRQPELADWAELVCCGVCSRPLARSAAWRPCGHAAVSLGRQLRETGSESQGAGTRPHRSRWGDGVAGSAGAATSSGA
mmetsp:Transcript_107704/g.229944  ORF Transcript_107704/g.229944 Transcript_107704/m.229944 type:complete len:204 (-) Transcript_107704:790-1401(-)